MTEITVKNYLQRIEHINDDINLKTADIEQLRELSLSVTAQISTDPVQTSKSNDKMGSLVAKIVDLQNEIICDIDRFLDERQKCINLIDQVEDPQQRRLLHLRYVQFEQLKEAAVEMKISYGRARAIHGEALEYIRKHIPAPDGYIFVRLPHSHDKKRHLRAL